MERCLVFLLIFSFVALGQQDLQEYREKLQSLKKRMEKLEGMRSDKGDKKKQLKKELDRLSLLKKQYNRMLREHQRRKKKSETRETALIKSLAKITNSSEIVASDIKRDYQAIGDIYWKQKRYREAEKAYLKSKSTGDPFALYKMACAHEKNGEWKKAATVYTGICSTFPNSVPGKQAAWNKNYLRWKQDFISKLSEHISEQEIRESLEDAKGGSVISPPVSDRETTPSVTAASKGPSNEKLSVETKSVFGKETPAKNIASPDNERGSFWSKQAIALVGNKHSSPEFSRLKLEKQRRKLSDLLVKVKRYRTELMSAEKKLTDKLDRTLNADSDFFLPDVFDVVIDMEKYHEDLEKRISNAQHALQDSDRQAIKDTYTAILPYANLNTDSPMHKAIELANAKISSQMKFSRIKVDDALAKSEAGEFPYVGAWYPALIRATSRLQASISADSSDPKIAAYRSRVKNYTARFESYPEEMAFLAEEISSFSQGKQWKKWAKKHIGGDSKKSLILQKFLKTQSLNPPLEQKLKQLRREIREMEHALKNGQNISGVMERLLACLSDIHEKYMKEYRDLREAVLELASSTSTF